MSLTITYRGNFGVSFSTESHVSASMEELGHEVVRLQENEVGWPETIKACETADLFWWTCTKGYALAWDQGEAMRAVETLNQMLPTVGMHLDLWFGLNRAVDVGVDPYWRLSRMFTADGDHDAEFAAAGIAHRWLPPAVYGAECWPGIWRSEYAADVAFVGNWRGGYHEEWWPHRERMLTFIRSRYSARMWPERRAIRGDDLNNLYASTKVTVGDSCFADRSRFYVSDRAFESVGRGAFTLFPYIEGLAGMLKDGEHICYYPHGDLLELGRLIRYYLNHDDEREAIRSEGQRFVRANHTYCHRVQSVVDSLRSDGLLAKETV